MVNIRYFKLGKISILSTFVFTLNNLIKPDKYETNLFVFFIGLLMTLYSALYKIIKKDIDNGTVLMLRGAIQVFQGLNSSPVLQRISKLL